MTKREDFDGKNSDKKGEKSFKYNFFFALGIIIPFLLMLSLIFHQKSTNSFIICSTNEQNIFLSALSHISSILFVGFGKIAYLFPIVLMFFPAAAIHLCFFICIFLYKFKIKNGIIIDILGDKIVKIHKYYVSEIFILGFLLGNFNKNSKISYEKK